MNLWNVIVTTAHGWSYGAVVLRLLTALLVGIVIGIDREIKNRGAGIRTHALVCLGAAMIEITSEYVLHHFPGADADLNRLGAQVVSGVGFLGAGTIIVTGKTQIRGLTTAAGLWACACLGLCSGIGFIEGTLIALLFVVFILRFMNAADQYIHSHSSVMELYVEFESNRSMSLFIDSLRTEGIRVGNVEFSKARMKGEGPSAFITLEIKDTASRERFRRHMNERGEVRFIQEL